MISLVVPLTTVLKYSPLGFTNFSKAAFGEPNSPSCLVLSSELLEANTSFGTNGVNLSERYSYL